jgi:hypothetical protein
MNQPKLKVKWYSKNQNDETICSLGEAKHVVFGHGLDVLVFVEGKMVSSYEELLLLTAQDPFKKKKTLKTVLVSVVAGG